MRICFLSREYPNETGWGGIGTYTYFISHALAKKGHEVYVISMSPKVERTYSDGPVLVKRIYHKKWIRGAFWDQLTYSFNLWRHIPLLIEQENIDIVECPDYYAEGFFLSKTKSKIPLVVRCHTPTFVNSALSGWLGLSRAIDDRCASALELAVIKSADKITSCSKALSRLIAKRCAIDLSTIDIIPNGIDINKFDNCCYRDFRYSLGISEEDLVVLFLGRLSKLKGMDLMIKIVPRILKRFSNVFFLFVGEEELGICYYEQKIKEKVSKAQRGQLIFTGPLLGVDKIKAIKSSDFLVVPSLWENFPYVCLEAMACAKPVVGTSVGGIPEIIEDGKNGLIFNPKSMADFEKCVVRLLQNEEERLYMGKNSMKIVESKFTDEIMAEKTLKIYEETLEKI
jgi:glycosyltransferase involved in cell wall biosynthesis